MSKFLSRALYLVFGAEMKSNNLFLDDIFTILERRLKKYIDLDKLDMLLKTIDLILFGSRLYSLAWVCTRAMQWLCN